MAARSLLSAGRIVYNLGITPCANALTVNDLKIDKELHDFIVNEALPGTGVDVDTFFTGFSTLVHDLAPK